MQHSNFFETLKEAHIRLRGAIVLYEKSPYYVLAITDHKKDGIFRIYLDPIGWDPTKSHVQPPHLNIFGAEDPALGDELDKWLEKNPNSGVLRKQMNSPLFDKFRPFPLGMVNQGRRCIHVEWQPTRSTFQGLTRANITEQFITLGDQPKIGHSGAVSVVSPEFRDCIVGEYPDPFECVKNLSSGDFENEAVGFHRNFAFIRGPIDTTFLCYKRDIIGWLPEPTPTRIILGRKYHHTREVVDSLGLFTTIQLR